MDFAARQMLRQRIRAIAEPVVLRAGCELVAVELGGGKGATVLRLYIDKPEGVAAEDCTRVSRSLSPELDVEDPIPVAYTLEVSSPGMERPLERSADFERFKGSRVRVKMPGEFGRRQFTGVLGGLEEGSLILEVAGGRLERIQLDQIERVRLDLTFDEFMRLAERPLAERGELP